MKLHVRVGFSFYFFFLSAISVAQNYAGMLGNGFDALKLEQKPTLCANGEAWETPSVEFVAEFNKMEGWSQLQSQLNFSVPGSIFLNSTSELAKFVIRARDTQFTSTYVLKNHVGVRNLMLQNPSVNIPYDDLRLFREKCGTEYISAVTIGGKLHVGIKFSFSSVSYKETFDAGGAIQSITGLGAHIRSLNKNVKQNSSVEIFFHQVGGNLSELNGMFDSADIVACSLDQFDKCENLLGDVWNYSKDRFAKAVLDGKAQAIGFMTSEYPNHPKIYEDLSVKKERGRLLEKLEQNFYDRDFLNSIKGAMEDYPKCDGRCLAMLLSQVTSNIRTLKDSIALSFTDPELFEKQGTLSQLELSDVILPKPRKDYHKWLRKNLPYIGTTLAVAVIVPVLYKMISMKRILGAAQAPATAAKAVTAAAWQAIADRIRGGSLPTEKSPNGTPPP
ncbi:MAG: hypothetical protein HYW48_04790 [Deltaproteobacteria bacterium]|nr:hypothetical protein [Deltaproteobacteria bacterium]